MYCWLIFLSLGSLSNKLYGQFSDTSFVSLNQLNHYYTVQARNTIGFAKNNWKYKLYILNNSSIYSTASSAAKAKTETSLEGHFEKQFATFRSGYAIKHFQLTDERSGILNDYKKTQNVFTIDFPKLSNTQIEAGFSEENRLNINDKGWVGRFSLNPRQSNFSPELNWEYDRTAYRTNYTFNNAVRINSRLANNIRNTSYIQYKQANREYFKNEEMDTERRLNINRLLSNTFHYPFNSALAIDYQLRYGSNLEKLNFTELDSSESRSRKHFEISNGFKILRKTDTWTVRLDMSLHEQQNQSSSTLESYRLPEDYTYLKKNIGARISRKLMKQGSVSLDYRVTLFQFTTPDSNNYDDRDELTYVIAPGYVHRVNPYLSISFKGNIYLHHLMYLSSRRSSQNHWNRIYSLEAQQSLQIPNHIIWQSRAKIYANYFVYDFENSLVSSGESMIFRGLSFQQNMKYFVTRNQGISAYFKITREDDGYIDWNELIQQLTIERAYYNIKLLYFRIVKGFQIQAGPTLFKRNDYTVYTDKERELRFYSKRRGLYVSVIYNPYFQFSYHFETIDQQGAGIVHNQSGSFRLNYYF